MSMNFKRIPRILTPDELMEMGLKRAGKRAGILSSSRIKRTGKVKRVQELTVRAASEEIRDYLLLIIKRTPRFHEIPAFYFELIGSIVSIDDYKNALGTLKWADQTIAKLEQSFRYKIRTSNRDEEMHNLKKAFYGRMKSILNQIDPQLNILRDSREALKNLPSIEEEFTVVIAGAPNVGKSSLIKTITSSNPRVENYPFTTQQLLLGYFQDRYLRYQIIDTPGVLDRPMKERNKVELQAILALKHLANVILFIFDPTEECGFTIDTQINILLDIENNFDTEFIIVANKMDISSQESVNSLKKATGHEIYPCSTKEKIGIEEIKGKIIDIRKRKTARE